jgi:hypothetical protein
MINPQYALGLLSIGVGESLVISSTLRLLAGLMLLFKVKTDGGLGLRFETKLLVARGVLSIRVIPVVTETLEGPLEERRVASGSDEY